MALVAVRRPVLPLYHLLSPAAEGSGPPLPTAANSQVIGCGRRQPSGGVPRLVPRSIGGHLIRPSERGLRRPQEIASPDVKVKDVRKDA